jgi:hypothetical protein
VFSREITTWNNPSVLKIRRSKEEEMCSSKIGFLGISEKA